MPSNFITQELGSILTLSSPSLTNWIIFSSLFPFSSDLNFYNKGESIHVPSLNLWFLGIIFKMLIEGLFLTVLSLSFLMVKVDITENGT